MSVKMIDDKINMVKLYMVWILSRHKTEKNNEDQQNISSFIYSTCNCADVFVAVI